MSVSSTPSFSLHVFRAGYVGQIFRAFVRPFGFGLFVP